MRYLVFILLEQGWDVAGDAPDAVQQTRALAGALLGLLGLPLLRLVAFLLLLSFLFFPLFLFQKLLGFLLKQDQRLGLRI